MDTGRGPPLIFWICLALSATFLLLYLIYNLFSWTSAITIGFLTGLYLILSYRLRVLEIKESAEVQKESFRCQCVEAKNKLDHEKSLKMLECAEKDKERKTNLRLASLQFENQLQLKQAEYNKCLMDSVKSSLSPYQLHHPMIMLVAPIRILIRRLNRK